MNEKDRKRVAAAEAEMALLEAARQARKTAWALRNLRVEVFEELSDSLKKAARAVRDASGAAPPVKRVRKPMSQETKEAISRTMQEKMKTKELLAEWRERARYAREVRAAKAAAARKAETTPVEEEE